MDVQTLRWFPSLAFAGVAEYVRIIRLSESTFSSCLQDLRSNGFFTLSKMRALYPRSQSPARGIGLNRVGSLALPALLGHYDPTVRVHVAKCAKADHLFD